MVFTHGLSANHTMFDSQIEYFKNKYTIITWDIPLHGLSRPYNNFTYENVSDDLNSILQNENIEQAILVEMSLGGYLNQEYIKKYSEKVLAFIALDTTPLSSCYYSKFDIWLLGRLVSLGKNLSEYRLRHSIAKIVSTTPKSYNLMITMLEELKYDEIITIINFAFNEFKQESDIKFNCPVLILIGENDKTGKIIKFCKMWTKKEGHALHYIKNASHFSHADNVEQVNSEIEDFIKVIL